MKRKSLLYLALFCAGFYLTAQFCLKKTQKFMTLEIISSRPNDPLFDTEPLSQDAEQEVAKALNQPYTYFGCGGQAFVFFSQDGSYALKFFKQRHFREPTHLNYIPFIEKYRTKKFANRRKRIQQEYLSYKIGYEEMPEETALLYLHLNKTSHLKKKIKVVDKLNIVHEIDLDTTDFILQRKADLVYSTIDSKISTGDLAGAKKTIDQVIELILIRCQKGLRDKDPNIATNCGILGDKAIKIDVGRFFPDRNMTKPLFYKPELYHLTRQFRLWLKNRHPELVSYLDEQVTQIVTAA